MNREEIKRYLQSLGQELQKKEVIGQILLAEGVVMLLDVKKPEESKDINAYLAYLKGEGPPVERRKDIDVRFGKRGAAIHEAALDIADIKVLAGKLGIVSAQDMLTCVMRYVPEQLLTSEMRLVVEQALCHT